jgi:hypothetical protein
MKRCSWISVGFSAFPCQLFWEFIYPRKWSQSSKKTLTVDKHLHHVQTEETDYKTLFSQPDHVPSKYEPPSSQAYTVSASNSFVALRKDVTKTPVSGKASSLAPMSSNVPSVGTIRFLSDILSSNDPVSSHWPGNVNFVYFEPVLL